MRNTLLIVLSILSMSVSGEVSLDGRVSLPSPSDSDMEKLEAATLYYQAKKKLNDAKYQAIKSHPDNRVENKKSASKAVNDSSGDDFSPFVTPRSLRGKKEGDGFDQFGEPIKEKKPPVAYVSVISGVGSNLSAEVFWDNTNLIVKKGDVLIGGRWKVQSVKEQSIMLQSTISKNKRFALGKLPVNIETLK